MEKSLEGLRAFRAEDIEGVASLLAQARAWPPTGAPVPEEVLTRWRRRNVRPEVDVNVVPGEAGGLIAYSQSSLFKDGTPRLSFELAVHPSCRNKGIGAALYNLIAEKGARINATHLSSPVFVQAEEDSPAYRGFLERRGFRSEHSYWQMRIDEVGRQGGPDWPEGISWRRFGDVARDAEIWARLVTACFDEYSSASMVAAQLSEPGGGPGGYFFAIDESSGHEIGTSRSRIDLVGDKRIGYVGTVGVLRAYRGKGVGEALVRRTLQHIADLGIQSATLLVEDHNVGARRLYERMGWRPVYRTDYYWKWLRPSKEGTER